MHSKLAAIFIIYIFFGLGLPLDLIWAHRRNVTIADAGRAGLGVRAGSFRKGRSVSTFRERNRLRLQNFGSKGNSDSAWAVLRTRWMSSATIGARGVVLSLALVALTTAVVLVVGS